MKNFQIILAKINDKAYKIYNSQDLTGKYVISVCFNSSTSWTNELPFFTQVWMNKSYTEKSVSINDVIDNKIFEGKNVVEALEKLDQYLDSKSINELHIEDNSNTFELTGFGD